MSTDVNTFENQNLALMANLALLEKQKKTMDEQIKQIKTGLEDAMDQYDIKSIDNEYLKITRVAASSSKSIDLKALAEKEPKLHGELLEDYPKVTEKRAAIRFTVKK